MRKDSTLMLLGGLIFLIGLGMEFKDRYTETTDNKDQNLETVSSEDTAESNAVTESIQEIQEKLDKVLEQNQVTSRNVETVDVSDQQETNESVEDSNRNIESVSTGGKTEMTSITKPTQETQDKLDEQPEQSKSTGQDSGTTDVSGQDKVIASVQDSDSIRSSASEPSAKSKVYVPRTDDDQRNLLKIPNLGWEKIQSAYAPSNGIEDWRKLQPARHWRKGRSAYEIAVSWENAEPDLPDEIKALFDDPVDLLIATPEHKTPLPGGSRPSQTDIIAFVRTNEQICAVAVEGKLDESFGPEVGEWLVNASSGKIERLQYISKKLGLSYPPADAIRYQLLHRTASAIIEAERFNADCAIMIVQSFSQEHAWFDDFSAFLKSLGISSIERGKLYRSEKQSAVPLLLGWATP